MDNQAIVELIQNEDYFLITSHVDPDGDNIASQLGLLSIFKELGKHAVIVDQDATPVAYQFLLNDDVIYHQLPPDTRYDYSFVLDAANLDRVGDSVVALIQQGNGVINIDHHTSNTRFGTYNWVEPEACATAIVVYKLAKALGVTLTPEMATRLYAGIITDTGRFRYTNTTLETFEVSADLVRHGANPSYVATQIYDQEPISKLRLLVKVLSSLQSAADGKIHWLQITKSCYDETGSNVYESENMINYATSIKGTKLAILFREMENSDRIRVSFRSKGFVNVDKLAQCFGGGGHAAAAGARIPGTLAEVQQKVLTEACKWV